MRYDNPALINELAAAYVLGTLTEPARRRLQRLAVERIMVREAIWEWEAKLLPMAEDLPIEHPRPQVWDRLEQRLKLREDASRQRRSFGWDRVFGGFAAGALALAFVMAILPQKPEESGPLDSAAERLALIQDTSAQPLWVITVDDQSGSLSSIAINAPARDADRVFELWMLPKSGAPRSFGLLPTGLNERGRQALSPALLALLSDAQGVAVSIEPPGGSPTGAPTGPVVYTAPVLDI